MPQGAQIADSVRTSWCSTEWIGETERPIMYECKQRTGMRDLACKYLRPLSESLNGRVSWSCLP
jgi:hypothetical protein